MTATPGESGDDAAADRQHQHRPTCYRHPNRETYIRCSRCERHICPDCMIAAPVGFHCPACVAEGAKTLRRARTTLGGEVTRTGDLVTKILIGINTAVFLGTLVAGNELTGRLALYGLAGFRGEAVGVLVGDYYRLITAAFLHEEIFHFGLNMYALWILGQMLEPLLGRWRFTALYLISALGGSAASLLALEPGQGSYGASGAVFGLLGGVYVINRKLGRDVSLVTGLLLLNVVIGFVVPGIDWRAHLGGLVTGAALSAVFAHAPATRRGMLSVVASVAVLLVVVMVVWWTVQSGTSIG